MRTTRRSALISLTTSVLLAVLSAGCELTLATNQFVVREEKRFAVTGTPQLDLTTFDGSIEIRGWDRQEVLIEIEKRGPDKAATDAIHVSAVQSGDTITVNIPKPGTGVQIRGLGLNVSPSAHIVASVPKSSNLVARSGDGSISLLGLSGRASLESTDGSVKADEFTGELIVRSGDGSVNARNVDGRADIRTEDGSVLLEGRLKAVQLETRDGSATLRAKDGSVMDADWEVRTGDGSVHVELPSRFDADIDAHTGDGTLHVDGAVVTDGGRQDKHTLKGKLGAGGKALRLESGDGSITVRSR